jgi:sensor c-di-GMP phosphodiesterase-like protein
MKLSLKAVLATLALSTLAGCASVPMADTSLDAAAKTFATTPDKANIYVYRHESLGAAIKMKVQLDGQYVGSTAAKTYMLLTVQPGHHTIASSAENSSAVELQTQAGQNYFVWQEVKMGAFSAGSKLQSVDEARAKTDMKSCKLIKAL